MPPYTPDKEPDFPDPDESLYDRQPLEEDLWFLPAAPEDSGDLLPPLPRADPQERAQIALWEQAQQVLAVPLAQVAMRFGRLDERLRQAPDGWRQRLALIEASDLSWVTGDRVSVDRLGLWQAMRLSAASDDIPALQRSAWAFRRLSGGPGPDVDLAHFVGRQSTQQDALLAERLDAWQEMMTAAQTLHPIARAGFAFHLWPLSGIGLAGDLLEGSVIAARISASDAQGGALFVPVMMGGANRLRGGGAPVDRLQRWLEGTEQGLLHALRHLDQLERWEQRAEAKAGVLSGRTPPLLIDALRNWPMISAPMAESLTGASRAAVQRNLAWFETEGLVQELTKQGRFRLWRAAL